MGEFRLRMREQFLAARQICLWNHPLETVKAPDWAKHEKMNSRK